MTGDDQRSLLSDSWSTDVVPSDSEGPAGGPLLGGALPFLPAGDNLMPGGARQQRGAVARYLLWFNKSVVLKMVKIS